MDETLGLLLKRTDLRLTAFRKQIDTFRPGRGSQLGNLANHVIDEFENEANKSRQTNEDAKRQQKPQLRALMVQNAAQRLERLQLQLDVLHLVLANYQGAVARADVPVGLQHLIDVLMKEVLDDPGDPIIHLNRYNMYSTVDIVHLLGRLLKKEEGKAPADNYPGQHPIAFNLPALDPGNVLLAPVLAHEVAHTAITQTLHKELLKELDKDRLLALLERCCSELGFSDHGEDAVKIRDLLFSWLHELLCDAVALMLSGPSFLFALIAFAPPGSMEQSGDTHPPVQFRIAFALGVLKDLGWENVLHDELGELMNWFTSVAEQNPLAEGPIESYLVEAAELSSFVVTNIARRHIDSHFTPAGRLGVIRTAARELADGLPMVQIGERVLSPWEIVLAAWFGGLKKQYEAMPGPPKLRADSIAAVAGQREYNELIVKTMEFSSIVSSWKRESS